MALRSIRSKLALALAMTVLSSVGVIASTAGAAQAACPDGGYTSTPGERIKGPNNDTVYMVDPEGLKRPIVGAGAYLWFFRSWEGIKVRNDISCVKSANLDLSFSSFLAQDGYGSYYFVEPYGTNNYHARGIPSVAVYDKYFFRWDHAQYVDQAWLLAHAQGVRAWT
ncbi:hypothetical protein GCM10010168_49990 [Actinoplanes ianthinogenes]|uniref:Uncharacterized protein n=1 Tax=Actinoplanes ianthinogenes TaxID=122358 RepID=A0ABM7M329_9ACTN|nr:hypothetical protein [Actinoplanes ianthinogenes]BCJ46051.1 hypothetical protein Aiant_67080 [Actinoplanes ianthinogenes]GGR25887.1 hypothetical protein GCM10010168_49990 [Actinoplanes ianthinogenes]